MSSLFYAGSAFIFLRAGRFLAWNSCNGVSASFWRSCSGNAGLKSVSLEFWVTKFHLQCYSTQKATKRKSRSEKSDTKLAVKDEKDAFFLVRKGNIVGVYKKLTDCQTQLGSSIWEPPVSVFKGYSLSTKVKEHLVSRGLKDALYSIQAADLSEGLFGTLVHCPLQPLVFSKNETSKEDLATSQEAHGSEAGTTQDAVGLTSSSNNSLPKDVKIAHIEAHVLPTSHSCILKFDGASKGNPGQSGAGAVLQTDDGNLICRLREGLGTATNNVAEYRAIILGLKSALEKGFTSICVRGDSKLVYMQIQGLWKVRHQNLSHLYEEANKLKDRFLSFQFDRISRALNSEADAQANLAIHLINGQVQEDMGEKAQ